MKNLLRSFLLLSTLTLGMCNLACKDPKTQTALAPADTMAPCKSLEVPDSVAAQRPHFRLSGAVPAQLRSVGIYYEIDYSFYVYLGGTVQKCQTYFNKLFLYIYAAAQYDSINVYVAGLKIDTVEDGINGNLQNFGARMAQVRPHADLAQLLTRKWSGGIAYIGSLCLGWNYQVSVCGMVGAIGSYPGYYWDAMVSIHECLGHNCGGYHTFACRFNGNSTPIDSSNVCWGLHTEGTCANGQVSDTTQLQTWLSYWHGCPGGIIPRRGFGWQQRGIIRNFIYQHQYCLVDTGNPPPPPVDSCVTPGNPFVSNVQPTRATLQWTSTTVLANINGYSVQWKPTSASAWTITQTTATSLNLSALTGSTSYDWKVQTICKNGTSTFTAVVSFTTPAAPMCLTPTSVLTDVVTSTTARGYWNGQGAQRFNVWLRVGATGTWAQNSVLGNFYTWINLVPSTMYQWQVQSICANGVTSSWSPIQEFTTLPGVTTCNYSLAVDLAYTFTARPTPAGTYTFSWKKNGLAVSSAQVYSGTFNKGDTISLSVGANGCLTPKTFTKIIQ